MKVIYFANTDWYLYNFRLSLALAMREKGHEVVLVSPPGGYVTKMEGMGLRCITFPFSRRGVNPLVELGVLRRLTSLYRQEKPDLVHHFTVKCVLYGSLAARQAGVPHVVNSITGLGYIFLGKSLQVRLLRKVVSRLYRLALKGTRVILQNPDDQELFNRLDLTGGAETILIRGSGIDVHYFRPVPETEASVPLVLLPARMLWDKGIREFVEAARILRREKVAARFALVGRVDVGNPAAISYDQLTEWQKEGIVEWWGWQEDIKAVFAMAHVICLPSYREGVPRVLGEAAACARAVVTTDVPGCREVVREGINGLLVPPRDAVALAAALKTLIRDTPLRRRMGICGRKIVEEEFSMERVVAQTLAVYDKMTGG